MPMTDFFPRADGKITPWLTNFTTVANANLTTLGLAAADVTLITNDTTAYMNALNSVTAAKVALKQAVLAKKAAEKKAGTDVRTLSRKIQGNAGVTPALKAQLGLTPRTGARTKPSPVIPATINASGSSDGYNVVTWSTIENPRGTVYIVEAATSTSLGWVQVGAVTKARFVHSAQTPGATVMYRVIATRSNMASQPTGSVTVYGAPRKPAADLQMAA